MTWSGRNAVTRPRQFWAQRMSSLQASVLPPVISRAGRPAPYGCSRGYDSPSRRDEQPGQADPDVRIGATVTALDRVWHASMLPEVIPSVAYPAGYVDTEAFAQLNELVAALARELADTELVPRRLAGKLWPVFARALAEPITPEGRQRFCTACFSRHSSVVRVSCASAGEEAEQLGHDPLVGVFLDVVAGVVELGHGCVGQGLAPLLVNRGRESGVAHRPHDLRGFGAEVLLDSVLEPGEPVGDRSGDARRVRELPRGDELPGAAQPRPVRPHVPLPPIRRVAHSAH